MRILHISSARSFGGGERHLADLTSALARRGHEVYVALTPRSMLREALSSLPAENIFTLRLRNALDVASALELARLVREHKIEIVHAHVARDYPLAAFAVRRNRHAKFVITRHVLFPLSRLHAFTLRRVSRVIAVSCAVERALAAQKIFPARKVTVIPNGIDFRHFDESLRGFDREKFCNRRKIDSKSLLVGTVGEIKRQKGHEDFLRATALVALENKHVHFIVAGGDNSRKGERRAALERLAGELGLTNRVHFMGQLGDVAELLAALDVYVSASHTESFGLAIVEAMASGLPVVATATEGAREIIDEGNAGVLVAVGDYKSLGREVLRLLEDEDERIRLGTLARAQARERFSLDRMVDETERIYIETMNAERGTRK